MMVINHALHPVLMFSS